VTLRANVEFREELGLLERYGAEGIGLLRTEMLFLTRPGCTMTEDEQVEVYRAAAEAAGPAGVTLRLLDLGGDKHLPVGHREPNPFLGWRGVRVLLDRPELLRPQLRAVLRANVEGRFRMLLPMVTTLDDVEHIRQALADEADRLSQRGIAHDASLPLGVMVEVPAVALQAEQFAEAVDFFSIGTNDLTQYTLAVDRGNDRVAHRYDAVHPAVLRLIRQTVRAARENDVPTTLCGEVASDPEAIPLLIGLGVDALSASPTYLPSIQRVVRHLSAAETSSLVAAALDAPDAASVRTRTRDWLREHLDVDLPDVQRLRPQPLSPDRAASAESASDGPAASQSDEDGKRSHGGLRSARFDASPDVSPES
jgi:phosphotransferase system enzyme I (PtsI)